MILLAGRGAPRYGRDGLGSARKGWQAGLGKESIGVFWMRPERPGKSRQAGQGDEGRGLSGIVRDRRGLAGPAWLVNVRREKAQQGPFGTGSARFGKAGSAGLGVARCGAAGRRAAGRREAGTVVAVLGMAGMVRVCGIRRGLVRLGGSWMASQVRFVTYRHSPVWFRMARSGMAGWARKVNAGHASARTGMARSGRERLGTSMQARNRLECQGRQGRERLGMAGWARCGRQRFCTAGSGAFRHSRHGEAHRDRVQSGLARDGRLARRVQSRLGAAWHRAAWQAWAGEVWSSGEWHGRASNGRLRT
jgi:hypothetical protein